MSEGVENPGVSFQLLLPWQQYRFASNSLLFGSLACGYSRRNLSASQIQFAKHKGIQNLVENQPQHETWDLGLGELRLTQHDKHSIVYIKLTDRKLLPQN